MLRLLANAKINWTLDIVGKRDDGYHYMDMLMGSVALADELTFSPADVLTLTMPGRQTLPVDDNLIFKAAHALRDATGHSGGAAITLHKHAPIGAGMGGGSADAAAALIGLNALWQTGLTPEMLQSIGLTVGADVPFMLTGGFARVRGIGEQLQPLPHIPRVPLLVVQPCQALSTKEVFTAFDAQSGIVHPMTDLAQEALLAFDLPALSQFAGNVLQPVSEAKRPQITEAIAALHACGAGFATMTGSGSAVFGAFDNEQRAVLAYRALHKRWRKCWLTHTATEGITVLD